MADGTTIGILDAATGQATARVESSAGLRGEQEVEPSANYFVGRVKRDFDNGNLVLGGMGSGVARSLDTTFAPRLAKSAEFVGADILRMWDAQTYSLRANAAFTNV